MTESRTGDEARHKALGGSFGKIDEAPNEVPDEGFWGRKGKGFGGKEENIEHRTSKFGGEEGEAREGFGMKFGRGGIRDEVSGQQVEHSNGIEIEKLWKP